MYMEYLCTYTVTYIHNIYIYSYIHNLYKLYTNIYSHTYIISVLYKHIGNMFFLLNSSFFFYLKVSYIYNSFPV